MFQDLTPQHLWIRNNSCKNGPGGRKIEALSFIEGITPASPSWAKGRELWNVQRIKANWEVIPLMCIVGGGLIYLSYVIIHNMATRDDVRWPGGSFGYDKEDNLDRIRKLITIKQKYKCPEGLKELYRKMRAAEK